MRIVEEKVKPDEIDKVIAWHVRIGGTFSANTPDLLRDAMCELTRGPC